MGSLKSYGSRQVLRRLARVGRRRRVGHDRAGLARDADIGAARIAHVDPGEASAEQGLLLVERGEAQQRAARVVAALGQRQCLAALEPDVPAPLADPIRAGDLRAQLRRRLEQGGELGDVAIGGGTDEQRQVGHVIELHRFEHHAVGVDQAQLAMVLPDRRGLTFDHVDDQCIGQPARDAGVADPAELEQPPAGGGKIDQGHRHRILIEGDVVDGEARDPVDAGDLDPLQREAGLADAFADREAGELRQTEENDRNHDRGDGEGAEQPAADPPHGAGRNSNRFQQPRRLLRASAAAARLLPAARIAAAAPGDPGRHNAASTIRSTRSA
jgi:hypothetical protein